VVQKQGGRENKEVHICAVAYVLTCTENESGEGNERRIGISHLMNHLCTGMFQFFQK